MIPGIIPAIKSFAMDSCTVTPYIINMIEGGINSHKVPDPAKLPSNSFSGYFLFLNSGIDIFPTVATVAADEPEIAANKAQPTTLT